MPEIKSTQLLIESPMYPIKSIELSTFKVESIQLVSSSNRGRGYNRGEPIVPVQHEQLVTPPPPPRARPRTRPPPRDTHPARNVYIGPLTLSVID